MGISRNPAVRRMVFGEQLARARIDLKLSQEALAEAVGTTARSISRWERNQTVPQQYYLERLCKVLQTTPEALFGARSGETPREAETAPLWYVPYARNPYFTGRKAFLHQLYKQLHTEHHIALTQRHVVSGLGGIGKTQTALEYIYLFRREYRSIFWINAETSEMLMADYLALAHLLQLPEKSSSDQNILREAVKRWFQTSNDWLLVFDNVENLELLQLVLPDTSQGHVLITTRSQMIGTLGVAINLPNIAPDEGALFLLRRAKLLPLEAPLQSASASMRSQAENLVDFLDNLPLALDQAGAYIEETGCTLAEYLTRYTVHRKALLGYRGAVSSYHPASVLTTFSLAFQQVEQASPAAADLLRVCAFLRAETIPEEFFVQAQTALGLHLGSLATDPLALDAAIRELRRFSLIRREVATRTFGIHRLLQAIILDTMDETEQRLWIDRIVQAMLLILPQYHNGSSYEFKTQVYYQRYITHILTCADWLEKWNIHTPQSGEFLYQAAVYTSSLENFSQAISLLLQALRTARRIFESEHPKIALYLHALAILYVNTRQYARAEEHFRQALEIREKINGPYHLEVADGLRELANLFCRKGMYSRAETLVQRTLAITQEGLGPVHYEVALVLALAGTIALRKGQLDQAEQQLLEAREIYRKTLGEEHFFAASCLRNLGYLEFLRGHYVQALAFYRQTQQIYEDKLGAYSLVTASSAHMVGQIHFRLEEYNDAEKAYQRALAVYKKIPEKAQLDEACCYIDLGKLALAQGNTSLAKWYVQHTLFILSEKSNVEQIDDQEIARCLLLIGDQLVTRGELMEAQTCYQRAQFLIEQAMEPNYALAVQCNQRLEELLVLSRSE